jgi:hypothetical protein
MMDLGWQDFLALGIVFAAIAYLARLAWGAFARGEKGGCASGCAKCSSRVTEPGLLAAGAEQIVSIPPLVPRTKPKD